MRLRRNFVLLASVVVFGAFSAHAEAPSSEALLQVEVQSLPQRVQAYFNQKTTRRLVKRSKQLEVFYLERSWQPYWVSDSRISGRADDLIEFIEESWEHGLNPNSYHLDDIQRLSDELTPENLAQLEIVLSDAYVRLAQDLTGIRVNPVELKTSKRFWRAPYEAEYLLSLLPQSYDIEDLMEGFEPKGKTYNILRKELRKLVKQDAPDYESVLPIRMSGLLHPYERHARVADLRVRLGVDADVEDPALYDDKLAAAIVEFQRENNLKPDGVVGRQTLEILNITRERKVHQIIANMERLRWVEEAKPEKFVVVNIPSATLWAIDDGEVAFEMPVIVGRKKRPTNMFITEIHGVRFNPTWTVPPTIKKEDILPKLQEDPEHLTRKGMELIIGRGEEAISVDPASVDWVNVTEEELKSFRMVQTPGAHNPLGTVRVLMPNRYNIYLHDTNEKHYFQRANRAASSGCVRLKYPEQMASFIMKERDGWDENSMKNVFAGGNMRDVFIQDPIPVYLLYYTVWINEEGDLVYGNDLYDYDKKLIKLLSNIDGFLIPVDNNGSNRG